MVKACYSTINYTNEKTTGGVIGSYSQENGSASDVANACYWNGTGATNGIGRISTPGVVDTTGATDDNATKVDNSATTWETAKSTMNTALTGTGWQYTENTDEATKASLPLILVSNQAGQ